MAKNELGLTTVQWNIHGGELRGEFDDPSKRDSYTNKDLETVIAYLKEINADIITLQETQWYSEYSSQARTIAQKLRMYRVEAPLSPSQFDPNARLSIAILSRFPLAFPETRLFKNPEWTAERPNGDVWDTHDKGILKADLYLPNQKRMRVATLHGFPAHEYGKSFEDPENQPVIKDMRDKIHEDSTRVPRYLVQGDFNIDARQLTSASAMIRNVVPFALHGVEIRRATIFSGETVDHILYRSLKHQKTEVRGTRSDHHALVSRFTVPS